MQPEGCLQICLLGDHGVGHSSFLRSFQGDDVPTTPIAGRVENVMTLLDLEGTQFRVRFLDNLGSECFSGTRRTVLSCAHLVMLCYAVDNPDSLASLEETWYPELHQADIRAPAILVGLKSDLRLGFGSDDSVSSSAAAELARRHGAFHYVECSALMHPESVQQVMDHALMAAKEYYMVQWQLSSRPHPYPSAAPDEEGPWHKHEAMTVATDHLALDVETIRRSLSMVGATYDRHHAYLRCDIPDLGLTSLDALRTFNHLQFLNVSGNRLRSLEPLGALRCLLHLNASLNLLVRTQGYTAPDQLETIDLSYNLIGEVGEWSVHKYLRELNLRGNFIQHISPGLHRNKELRMLDLSENYITRVERLDGLQLRTLYLAQNRLTSLAGVGTLSKLQVLNVRHNLITSLADLRSEDVPRLRKLCVSENRIYRISEVEGLQSFPHICDLFLAPNPLVGLSHYRSQVLFRIPSLRLLDNEPVAAEEKVKSEVIYGMDVENRCEIFKNLLPEEDFIDRRLVTRETILEAECTQLFGGDGDAGPYGFAEVEDGHGAPGGRSQFQEAHFRHLLETARLGGTSVLDMGNIEEPFLRLRIFDEDVPELLEAVVEGRVQRLVLGQAAAELGTLGVCDILDALRAPASALIFVDLAGCRGVGSLGNELLSKFPYARGCSLEAADCGLTDEQVIRLRNQTAEAQAAINARTEERNREEAAIEAYMKDQERLEAFAEKYCTRDLPPDPVLALYDPERWRFGPDEAARKEYEAFIEANPTGMTTPFTYEDFYYRMVDRSGMEMRLSSEESRFLTDSWRAMLRPWDQREEDVPDEWDEALPAVYCGEQEEEGEGFMEVPDVRDYDLAHWCIERPLLNAFMAWVDGKPAGSTAFKQWQAVEAHRQAALEEKARQEEERRKELWHRWQRFQSALTEEAAKAHDGKAVPNGVASGQIIAHFSYLCCFKRDTEVPAAKLLQPDYFRLKHLSRTPRQKPTHGVDLHAAVRSGQVELEAAQGSEFRLGLQLKNVTTQEVCVTVREGSIWQHVDWQHRQNLMVKHDYVLILPPQDVLLKTLEVYCMNLSCACSAGNPMQLTEWYLDDSQVLSSQTKVWDHFEGIFDKTKER